MALENVKNVALKTKVDGTTVEIWPRTGSKNVMVDEEGTSLDAKITSLDSDIATAQETADSKLDEAEVEAKVAVEEAARKAHIGELGKVSEEEDAADHTVKSYVDAKVAAVEAEAQGDITYTNEAGTTVAVGGIAKGTTFDEMSLKDIIENMLYPYVAITAGSLTITATKTLEVGDSTTFSSGTVSYTKGSKNCVKLEILDGSNNVLGTNEGTNVASGSTVTLDETETVSVPTSTGSSATVSYKGRVTDAQGTTKTTSAVSFNFYRPYYVGTMDAIPAAASDVTGLTKNIAARPATLKAENKANKYWVVAYPATYSDIKADKGVLDANGFDVTGNITKTTMDIECLDGETKSYKVYYGLKGTADATFTVTFA